MERAGCSFLAGREEGARRLERRCAEGAAGGGSGKSGGEVRVHGRWEVARGRRSELPGNGRGERGAFRHGKLDGEKAVCRAESGAGGASRGGNETPQGDLRSRDAGSSMGWTLSPAVGRGF